MSRNLEPYTAYDPKKGAAPLLRDATPCRLPASYELAVEVTVDEASSDGHSLLTVTGLVGEDLVEDDLLALQLVVEPLAVRLGLVLLVGAEERLAPRLDRQRFELERGPGVPVVTAEDEEHADLETLVGPLLDLGVDREDGLVLRVGHGDAVDQDGQLVALGQGQFRLEHEY